MDFMSHIYKCCPYVMFTCFVMKKMKTMPYMKTQALLTTVWNRLMSRGTRYQPVSLAVFLHKMPYRKIAPFCIWQLSSMAICLYTTSINSIVQNFHQAFTLIILAHRCYISTLTHGISNELDQFC